MSQSSPDDATAGKTKKSPAKSARRLVQRDGLPNHFRTASAAASCPAHEWVTPPWLCAGRPSHQRILDAFIAHGPMTPDELAEKIERSVFYTRPRCSELCAMGLLHRTGEAIEYRHILETVSRLSPKIRAASRRLLPSAKTNCQTAA